MKKTNKIIVNKILYLNQQNQMSSDKHKLVILCICKIFITKLYEYLGGKIIKSHWDQTYNIKN